MKQKFKNKVVLVLFALIFVCFVALRISQFTASQEDNNTNQTAANSAEVVNAEKDDFSLSLEIREPYSNTTYQIDQQGQLDYQKLLLGLQANPVESKVLTPDQIVDLKTDIDQSDFFDLDSAYRPRTTESEITISVLNISWGNNENSVLCEGDCPNSFNNLVDRIKNLWTNQLNIENL